MRRFALLVAGLALLAGVAATVSGGTQPQARWVITDLGTLGGADSSARAINERGQVVGYAETKLKDNEGYPISHAFLWERGRMRDLGSLGERRDSDAISINRHGEVVGSSGTRGKGRNWLGDPAEHAFLWKNGRMLDLGTLGGPESWASDVNDRGQVVGWADLKKKDGDSPPFHAFLWENGRMRDLGSLGGPESVAVAINERGEIIGWSQTRDRVKHAFLWRDGRMYDFGTLGGFSWRLGSEASDINERGAVVGWAITRSEKTHAFLWKNGRMVDLGTLGGVNSEAVALNESGQVTGSSYIKRRRTGDEATRAKGDTIVHACLWANGRIRDLGTADINSEAVVIDSLGRVVVQSWLGKDIYGNLTGQRTAVIDNGRITRLATLTGRQSGATSMNNRGQVVGWSTTKSGLEHAVLWTLKRG